MSLYSYVPDKQSLVYEMTKLAGGELELPEPTATGGPGCTLTASSGRCHGRA